MPTDIQSLSLLVGILCIFCGWIAREFYIHNGCAKRQEQAFDDLKEDFEELKQDFKQFIQERNNTHK